MQKYLAVKTYSLIGLFNAPSAQEAAGSRTNHVFKQKNSPSEDGLFFMVGVAGLEPAASWSRTKRDTKLRHTPLWEPLFFHSLVIILYFNPFVNDFFILFLKKALTRFPKAFIIQLILYFREGFL